MVDYWQLGYLPPVGPALVGAREDFPISFMVWDASTDFANGEGLERRMLSRMLFPGDHPDRDCAAFNREGEACLLGDICQHLIPSLGMIGKRLLAGRFMEGRRHSK